MKTISKLAAGAVSAAMSLSMLATLPAGLASASVLVNDTFDRDFDGWYNVGDLTSLKANADAGLDSARGMTVSNRQTPADGAGSDKGFYLDGGMLYDYSIWVNAATEETYTLTLTWYFEDGTSGSKVITTESAPAGEWTEISGSCAAPNGSASLTVTLTTDSTNDFSFDNFSASGRQKAWGSADIRAKAADLGLKDMCANHFRVGTCMPGNALNNSTIKGIILREFNSVTCENELKPDATLRQSGSSNSNINVSLQSASGIMNFCSENNIAMRGHTFVWHSQTPSWFFKSDFGNGGWVDTTTMNGRLESYIKNMFAAIAEQYPDLNLYAYDVCNECVADGSSGGPRQAGDNNQQQGTSAWVSVYKDNSFIKQAFTYAKQYRPEGCKLFYNDYNEYEGAKKNGIMNILKDLKAADVIDGMGMQSHITRQYTSLGTYVNAMREYADAVGCVHITELDIDNADPDFYSGIMEAALEMPEVEAFVVWGTTDGTSWRRGTNCLLFDDNGGKKSAYNAIVAKIDPADYGDGNNPVTGGGSGPKVYEPDEDGCYYHNTFEEGTERWSNRGNDTVAQKTGTAYLGNGAVYVSDRGETWNGVARSLSSNPFKAGETFSFGTMVMYTDGDATQDFKLTLQYSANGTEEYDEIKTVTVKKGEWTLLANDAYTIPAGASGATIYVETPEAKIDFYIDEAYGGIKGALPATLSGAAVSTTESTTTTTTTTTTTSTSSSTPKKVLLGDVDCNGAVDLIDAVALCKASSGIDVGLTAEGKINADINSDGSVNSNDLTLMLKYLAGIISKF